MIFKESDKIQVHELTTESARDTSTLTKAIINIFPKDHGLNNEMTAGYVNTTFALLDYLRDLKLKKFPVVKFKKHKKLMMFSMEST